MALRAAVPREGLAASWRGGSLRDLARDVVAIARDGLRARSRRDAAGRDESIYLAPLEAIAAGEPTQAEHWLARFHQAWQGDVATNFRRGGDLKRTAEPCACSKLAPRQPRHPHE